MSIQSPRGGGGGAAPSGGPTSPRAPFGLTQEQLRTELYTAWRKDLREPATPESFKAYRAMIDAGLREKEVVVRSAGVGVNFAISLASLLARSGVTKFDLHGNLLQDAGAEAVAHLMREAPALTHLNLGANDIGPQGLHAIGNAVAAHRKLQVLILGSTSADQHVNRIDPTCGKSLIEACARCKTVKVIDLARNPVGRGAQDAFSMLARLVGATSTMQVVKLGHTEMTSEAAVELVEAARKSNGLTELQLQGNGLHARVGEAVGLLLEERAKRHAPSTLKTVVLHSNPGLGSAGTAPIFRSLAADKGLSTLDLHGCNVDNGAALLLCDALDSNGTLTSLDLRANDITEVGIAELARSVMGHPALQHLGLSKNRVRDDGACALAAMLETNKVLQSLEVASAWIGDRGAIAIGVALANNRQLHTLDLEANHISEDGGCALVALLEKSKTLLSCNLRSNSIFHNTTLQLQRIIQRNAEAKEGEVPNRLRREVVRLHYQRYKLEEAKAQLDVHRGKKYDIERELERCDAKHREDELDFHKRRKEMEDALRDQQNTCETIDTSLKTLHESFERFCIQNKEDTQLLEAKLEAEVAERQKAEAEFQRVQSEIQNVEQQRKARIDDLQIQIQAARQDREQWAQQTKELRTRMESVQGQMRTLEGQLAAKEAGGGGLKETDGVDSKPPEKGSLRKRSTTGKKGGNTEAISNLLGDG